MLVTLAKTILYDCPYDHSITNNNIPVHSNWCICQKNYVFYEFVLYDEIQISIFCRRSAFNTYTCQNIKQIVFKASYLDV